MKDGSSTDLLKICQESTPPCQLNPLLFNGHLQTMWTAMKEVGPQIYYKRRLFESDDSAYAGSYAVDFVAKPFSELDDSLPPRTIYFSNEELGNFASVDSRPMLIVLHGLSGGSYESYLRHVLALLVGVGGEKQWEACVINCRGCAMHKPTTSILYNARATWDCQQTVKWLGKIFPNRPLYGIGFSMGANILTNYIGEEGSSSLILQSTWLGRQIYSKTMANNMKRLVELHHNQLSKNPKLNFEKIRKVKYLYEFDRMVQGPAWGYPTEGAYYRDASSIDSLLAARIPMFLINAIDDPIVADESLPYEEVKQNPYTILCTTSLGGHLAWYENGGSRWHAKPAANFLNKMAFETQVDEEGAFKTNGSIIPDPIDARFKASRRKWNVSRDIKE
ncbi:hypothetical protein B7494_g6617 [Chlorociboria aeruginascens]|nr:hypothetical protein B7494_g6617 [Chlorociboria aeruginascens]